MKNLICLCIAFTMSVNGFTQDIIYTNDSSEIESTIIEITSENIKYKNYLKPEGPIRNILIMDVCMIIYESGYKEVFSTENTQNINIERNKTVDESLPSKNNKIINIIDDRPDKIYIGKAPNNLVRGSGLIVQPRSPLKDKKGDIYKYAKTVLNTVLETKILNQNNNSNITLEVHITELFHEVKAGIYGTGRKITQNCNISIKLISNDNNEILFDRDYTSVHASKLSDFLHQLDLLYQQFYPTLSKKELKKKRNKFNHKYYTDFIVVFDDITNRILNDTEFQSVYVD
ncbi:MAG: hypothetical protein K8S00_12950 [Bacteroidales bacterium]|nr:hypothetical protein [Bacteroidales bacterium]